MAPKGSNASRGQRIGPSPLLLPLAALLLAGTLVLTGNMSSRHPAPLGGVRNAAASEPGPYPASALLIRSFVAAPAGVFLGEHLSFNVTVTGGAPPYSFLYAGLPPGCATANESPLSCLPNASGSFYVEVQVRDSASGNVSRGLMLTVEVPQALEMVAVDLDRRNVSVGQPVRIHPEVIGSVGNLTYAFPTLPTGCISENVPTLTCTPQAAGNFTVRANVVDSLGRSANGSRVLAVFPGPLSVASFNATPATLAAGTSTVLTVVMSGAVGPVSYAYAGLPRGCPSFDSSRFSCTPTEAGGYLITVTARDFGGRTTKATLSLDISNEAPPTITSFYATQGASPSGSPIRFVVDAYGGLGWLTYSFQGLPTGCASANTSLLVCPNPPDGNYRVSVVVTDANGVSSKSSTFVLVGAEPQVVSPSGGLPRILPGILMTVGVVSAVAGVVLVGLWWRRRRA